MQRLPCSVAAGYQRSRLVALAKLFIVALLFAVNTTTVRLTIQPHSDGFLSPLLPAKAKVLIIKPDAVFERQLLALVDEQLMVLVSGVQQGGGEGLNSSDGCGLRGMPQPQGVATCAPFLFMKNHHLEEFDQTVLLVDLDRGSGLSAELLDGVDTAAEFLIGVDVGVIEESDNLMPVPAELLYGVNSAWAAAEMHQYLHYLTLKCFGSMP
jgi:hypothetical protein